MFDIEKIKKTVKKKDKNNSTNIIFVGTRNELAIYLQKKNFWKNDKQNQKFIENQYLLIEEKGDQFGEFTIDLFSREIYENGTGFIYSIDNAPTYPQKINICINAEGYSQYEINKAISSLSHEMEKNKANRKEGFKDFYIIKN